MKLFITVVLLFGVSQAQQCDVGWTQRPNTNFCYIYKSTPTTFSSAINTCSVSDAVLSNVGDQAEQDFIAGLITSQTSDVWIGFADSIKHEGIWHWYFEPCKTYLNWDEGQPSYGNGGTDCAVMKSSQASSYRWDDTACTNRNAYVCKKLLGGGSVFDLNTNMECFFNCFTKFPSGTCLGAEYLNDTCFYETIKFDHTSNGVDTSYIACTTEIPPQPTTDGPSTTAAAADTTTTAAVDTTTTAAADTTTTAAADTTTTAAADTTTTAAADTTTTAAADTTTTAAADTTTAPVDTTTTAAVDTTTTAAADTTTTAATDPPTTRPQGGRKHCKKRQ
ncbi:uncharacterized protein LOC131948366 [Physella acuta]|uniref:uncharacterized protein LOC131948366 n=1 Tax=Physella acuta TaxID=109671 RepID=UPI0027DE9669|nr:uncharacterized protein LOC131948366 [Physella acuta]XP_059165948.1 uncharacterized protein LOC131948366 [Physella acuta]XP_059165949.1 uncharacterized protein LOC131948366 [Physella acuta]